MSKRNLKQQPLWVRVVIMIFFALAIQLPPIFLIYARKESKLSWIGAYFVSFLVLLGLALWASQQLGKSSKPIMTRQMKIDWVLGGWLAVFCAQFLFGTLNQLIYHQTQTANNQIIIKLMSNQSAIMYTMAFGAVVLSPIIEELIFRRIFIDMFFDSSMLWWPTLISGLIFSAEHASTNPLSFLIYFAMGVILAFVYQKTRRLSCSIMIHGLNNLLAMSAILLNFGI